MSAEQLLTCPSICLSAFQSNMYVSMWHFLTDSSCFKRRSLDIQSIKSSNNKKDKLPLQQTLPRRFSGLTEVVVSMSSQILHPYLWSQAGGRGWGRTHRVSPTLTL